MVRDVGCMEDDECGVLDDSLLGVGVWRRGFVGGWGCERGFVHAGGVVDVEVGGVELFLLLSQKKVRKTKLALPQMSNYQNPNKKKIPVMLYHFLNLLENHSIIVKLGLLTVQLSSKAASYRLVE